MLIIFMKQLFYKFIVWNSELLKTFFYVKKRGNPSKTSDKF